MRNFILLLSINIFCCISINAQQSASIKAVIDLLKQTREGYDSIHNLSFDVSYTYSKLNAPKEILDSLSGKMQVSDKRYHWEISNTEMIANSNYVIMLFKEDKLMYITKPGSQNMNFDPLARLDSSLVYVKGLQCIIENQKNFRTATLIFPDSCSYKQIKLTINKNTGFMTQAEFIVKQGVLQDFGDFDDNNKLRNTSYSVIHARYYNYSRDSIPDAVFDEQSYFKQSGTEFSVVIPYTDYKIFTGSPNL